MKRKIKALVMLAAFWAVMFFAFWEGEVWAQNIMYVFLWIMYLLIIVVAHIDEVADDLRSKGRPLPAWLSVTSDLAVFFILAASGWFWTSALCFIAAMHGLYIFDHDREVRR